MGRDMNLLIVDDDNSVRTTLYEVFKDSCNVNTAASGEEALSLFETNEYDVVLTDHQMSKVTGLDVIKIGKEKSPHTAFILLTAYATIQQAVEAIKIGAEDYMMKPFDIDEVEHRVNKAFKISSYQKRSHLLDNKSIGLDRMIGESSNTTEAKTFIQKISDVDSSVLILGPSGVGKEVMSQTIHETSLRKSNLFVAINCATLSEQLIESELFGHEKGSFTGATAQKLGKFEIASEGTIFLDEIGELPIQLQSKLLRVLQEKEFSRVGGTKTIKTNARVIAATNRDLKTLAAEGNFREDLYFRLNVLTFPLLELKERKQDIPLLCDFFWTKLSSEIMRGNSLDKEVIEILSSYDFPGNIRELKNILERMMVLGPKDGIVTKAYLPHDIIESMELFPTNTSKSKEHSTPSNFHLENGLTQELERLETLLITDAMDQTGYNQVKAADLLQIKRATLQYKLKKHNIKNK